MDFDYDAMPSSGKETSYGLKMRECNNCGNRTYMIYEEQKNYKVVCEYCEETHSFKSWDSMDAVMEFWNKIELVAECEYCPLGWEERGYEGECYDYGCYVNDDKEWCLKPFKQRWEKYQELMKGAE